MRKSLLFLLPLVPLSSIWADITLPPLISDNMLLQRAQAAIWGKADPGEAVTVKLGAKEAKTTAGKDGKWRVNLDGLEPGLAGDMTVSGKNSLTVHNVAVGDVWVCSGQSNMAMTLKSSLNPSGGVVHFEQEIAAAHFPKIRMFNAPRNSSETPVEEIAGKWEVCTPENVPHWSATGYFFGRKLHQDLEIPIGLIHSSWPGTNACAWTPTEVLQGDPDFKTTYYDKRQKELANYPALQEKYEKETLVAWKAAVKAAKAEGKPEPKKPRGPGYGGAASTLYNAMIFGATKYPIKGAIWYQGESNAGDALRYRRLLPAMITSWRKAWNQPELPFYIVQLANFMAPTPEPTDTHWALLRESQRLTSLSLPNSGLAVAIDIGEEKSVHPANKQEVGIRLALVAEAKTYGKDIVYSGPAFDTVKFDGANATVAFKPGTALGLAAKDGGKIKEFALAGADQKFVWADAKIVASQKSKEPVLTLTAPGVEHPVAVRYAWANNPAVNLVNQAGLPAVPFRTDEWLQAVSRHSPTVNPKAQ
ncbi:MAG: sialate O-acetylesterase [Verrucomicrobia bacterium]|nr:sialate O-acetylesterase [Verrucomicrobiota bacterium]